ncbi:YlbF family regulator [Dellaglioa sp. P0083]|uniref:YlbF family regulator n=1 Tax=Dellaglioa kimchii TaxID=3344667 RepID=UPI0038D499FF
MVVNIYDTANQMSQDLSQTEEYKALKSAYTKMQEDEIAYKLFKEFQTIQMSLQQKQMNGEEMTDEELENAHNLSEKIGGFDTIKDLMVKEQVLSEIMNEVNSIITKPIQDLYHN